MNGFKATSQIVTSTSASSSSIPMKVVFVNALNSSGNAQQSVTKQQITLNKSLAQFQAQGSNSTFITNKLLSASQQQPQKVQLVSNQLSTPNLTASISSSPSQKTITPSNTTNSHHHHHQSTGKSSKSLLGSSKLPGRSINFNLKKST